MHRKPRPGVVLPPGTVHFDSVLWVVIRQLQWIAMNICFSFTLSSALSTVERHPDNDNDITEKFRLINGSQGWAYFVMLICMGLYVFIAISYCISQCAGYALSPRDAVAIDSASILLFSLSFIAESVALDAMRDYQKMAEYTVEGFPKFAHYFVFVALLLVL
ncbi:hypothetical protein ABW19_dt0200858 [Dactylella cylindrospora]|nr:hypothetical protein ABW19_dt0200858 [Dactylella cylindrospora]